METAEYMILLKVTTPRPHTRIQAARMTNSQG